MLEEQPSRAQANNRRKLPVACSGRGRHLTASPPAAGRRSPLVTVRTRVGHGLTGRRLSGCLCLCGAESRCAAGERADCGGSRSRVGAYRLDFMGRIQFGPNVSDTRIHFSTYPKFVIRLGYVSVTYPLRIRIRYVSDTRYGPPLEYPRIVGATHHVCVYRYGHIIIHTLIYLNNCTSSL
jgi:hypothetical protein